jgi:C4-dicarboxylate-specific signal transduction histidine kinase
MQVNDNGPGVVPEMADSIFEAYQTTKMHGMGLGLHLSLRDALAKSRTATTSTRTILLMICIGHV